MSESGAPASEPHDSEPHDNTPHDDTTRFRGERPESLFGRIFPGPAPTDPRVTARLEALARVAERRAGQSSDHRHAGRPSRGAGTEVSPSAPSAPAASADDLDRVVDALHEQTDVLRSLLDADIAIRDDARSTAQNSRTFAIAGTVIALFTMVAAVVTVLIAFAP